MSSVLDNAFLHRRSYLTNSKLLEKEPHESHINVLAHESLWIDSEHIPKEAIHALRPLLPSVDSILDISNNQCTFDVNGVVSEKGAYLKKVVRHELSVGTLGELISSTINLKHVIHPRYARDGLYFPVLEVSRSGLFEVLPEHLWSFESLSGIILPKRGHFFVNEPHFFSFFQYVGRIGLSDAIKSPTTDDIREGAVNKYMTRETFDTWLGDSTNIVISVGSNVNISTDDIREGTTNHFFTQQRFDDALLTKTLDDIPDGSKRQALTTETLQSLNRPIGSVTDISFNTLLGSPEIAINKLYVERIDNEDRLMFNSAPVGRPVGNGNTFASDGPNVSERNLGQYSGTFSGSTTGVHTGDVIGNVSGFVSNIDNHNILKAKLLGNGEGHWTGTVNGDVVGRFEGHAKIITGSVDNAYHLTVGTYDTGSSLLHISGSENHIRLTNDGRASDIVTGSGHVNMSAIVSCDDSGSVVVSASALISADMKCENLDCTGSIKVSDLHTDHLTCVGIHNNNYGIFEAGVIEGASDINAQSVTTVDLQSKQLVVDDVVSDTLSLSSMFGRSVFSEQINSYDIKCGILSVGSFHINNLQLDGTEFLSSTDLTLNALSVSEIYTSKISTNLLNVSGIITTDTLSVSSIVGIDFTYIVETLSLASIASLTQYIDERLSISNTDFSGAISCAELSSDKINASTVNVSSLSVHTIHGINLTTDISVSGVTQNLSVSDLTSSRISCSVLSFDSIVRNSPSYYPNALPAIMTTSPVAADVAFMRDDSQLQGDMIIQGSLFVTDSIFIGLEPSLNIENVNALTASFISVGTLHVDMITGLSGGINSDTDLIENFFNEGDTVHAGNMKVDGNLIVTGLLATGTNNALDEFSFTGNLSVGGDIYMDTIQSVKDAILNLRARVDALEVQ